MNFKTYLNEANKGQDVIKVTVPLFIRILEWAREEAKSDVEVHELTEKIVKMNGVLSTEDYDKLFKD